MIGKRRMFFVYDGFTHGELPEMAQEHYDLDKKTEMVELTYSLPDVILEQMGPDIPLCIKPVPSRTWR